MITKPLLVTAALLGIGVLAISFFSFSQGVDYGNNECNVYYQTEWEKNCPCGMKEVPEQYNLTLDWGKINGK